MMDKGHTANSLKYDIPLPKC